jgi:aspartate/methionine/tyrosine aminotransferase
LLNAFFSRRTDLFEWTPPNASTIGFARFKPAQDVESFCERLVREAGVLLLPGTVYDEPRHIRFGYGRRNMPESLAHLESWLATFH